MVYAFGGRIDDDSYAVTYVDEDHGTSLTRGEINGVPFETGGGLIISTDGTLNKTYNEITALVSQGIVPFFVDDRGYIFSLYWYSDEDGYGVAFGYYDPVDREFIARSYYSSTADGQMVLDE